MHLLLRVSKMMQIVAHLEISHVIILNDEVYAV